MKYVLVFLAGMITGVALLLFGGCCVVAGRSDEASERAFQEMEKRYQADPPEEEDIGRMCQSGTQRSRWRFPSSGIFLNILKESIDTY